MVTQAIEASAKHRKDKHMKLNLRQSVAWAWVAGLVVTGSAALAHGDEGHAKHAEPVRKEQKPWGIAAEARMARRVVEIRMSDAMRFTPERIQVRQGETVKLVIRNEGRLLHELVLGTKQELDEHAALMRKFPGMEHDEPYMVHVPAGKTGAITWTFNRPGRFDFACLIAGHYEAGMVGTIEVLPTGSAKPSPAQGEAHTEHKH